MYCHINNSFGFHISLVSTHLPNSNHHKTKYPDSGLQLCTHYRNVCPLELRFPLCNGITLNKISGTMPNVMNMNIVALTH